MPHKKRREGIAEALCQDNEMPDTEEMVACLFQYRPSFFAF